MNLIGQAKEDFEKWYIETECEDLETLGQIREEFRIFYNVLTDSMQYGVYVDWFATVKIGIGRDDVNPNSHWVTDCNKSILESIVDLTRIEAITKGNELFNNRA
jgi:hypothetical protein